MEAFSNAMIQSATGAVELAIGLVGVMALFLGLIVAILTELADCCTSIGIIERGQLLLHGPIHEVYRRIRRNRHVEIRFNSNMPEGLTILRSSPHLRDLQIEDHQVTAELETDDEGLAEILQTMIDGNVAYSVVLAAASSPDMTYDGVDPADVSVTNTDDEIVGGVTVSAISGNTTESGGTATFSVVLTAQRYLKSKRNWHHTIRPLALWTLGVVAGFLLGSYARLEKQGS